MSDQRKAKDKAYSSPSLRFILAWLPIFVVSIGGGWTAYQYWTNRADTERTVEISRRIEAQRPFLEQKLKLYVEASQLGSKLIEWDIDPKSADWTKAAMRFWELRWSELELMGDPAIRQAMRRVGQQIVETEYNPKRSRHDLRWMVECLADALRISLEKGWGSLADNRIIEVKESDLPSGCAQGRERRAFSLE